VKFFLVVGFFMHLRYDHPIMRALFVGPLIIAIVIILAVMALFGAFVLLRASFSDMAHVVPGPAGHRPSGPTASTGPPGPPIPPSSAA